MLGELDAPGVPGQEHRRRYPERVGQPLGRTELTPVAAPLERDFAADAYQEHDLVFCDQLGPHIHPQRGYEVVWGASQAGGHATGTLPALRHTAATLALTSAVPGAHRG